MDSWGLKRNYTAGQLALLLMLNKELVEGHGQLNLNDSSL